MNRRRIMCQHMQVQSLKTQGCQAETRPGSHLYVEGRIANEQELLKTVIRARSVTECILYLASRAAHIPSAKSAE